MHRRGTHRESHRLGTDSTRRDGVRSSNLIHQRTPRMPAGYRPVPGDMVPEYLETSPRGWRVHDAAACRRKDRRARSRGRSDKSNMAPNGYAAAQRPTGCLVLHAGVRGFGSVMFQRAVARIRTPGEVPIGSITNGVPARILGRHEWFSTVGRGRPGGFVQRPRCRAALQEVRSRPFVVDFRYSCARQLVR